jgi:POT family proton-dependent oligopeptide transporter
MMFGWEFPTTWGQSFNPIFIVIFGPVFAALWVFLSKRKMNPSIPNKFTLGLLQVGLGFGVLVLAAKFMSAAGLVPLWTLVFCYLLHTTGELCLSPVGLSMVTKLAPARMTGLVMGAWFLSIAGAHSVAAFIARLTGGAGGDGESLDAVAGLGIYSGVFFDIFKAAMVATVLLFALSPILKKWLHGVE